MEDEVKMYVNGFKVGTLGMAEKPIILKDIPQIPKPGGVYTFTAGNVTMVLHVIKKSLTHNRERRRRHKRRLKKRNRR